MTITPTAEPRSRVGQARTHEPATSPTVEALREQSHETIARLVTMLGYPAHWADELEQRAFAAGRVWGPGAWRDEEV